MMLRAHQRQALLLVFALVIAVDGWAQTATARYPWDKRPDLCFQSGSNADPRCAAENWPTWSATVQRVADLYNNEQFPLLERAMSEIASSKKTFTNGDSPASAAYWVFRRLMPAPGTQQSHEEKIARWRNAVTASAFASFAQARFMYGSAWNIRGSGTAGSVSRESWELFSIRLQEAENILLKAPDALKSTPYWHNLLLAIVQDSPHSQRDVESVFKEGVSGWPRYFELYEVRLTRLVPRWGGSWEEVESFIDKWSRALSASEGDSAYARFYISLKNQGVTPDQTRMDWPRMKASLKELTSRYPDGAFKNLHASYACSARDKPSFAEAMSNLSPDALNAQAWLPGHSYEACMRWAGT